MSLCLGWKTIERSKRSEREHFFMVNGARLLEELISSCAGKVNPIRIFSAEELEKATDNYDKKQILVVGGMYTAYKGSYRDRAISIRRLNFVSAETVYNAFNEIVMLSQINHRNVVKLLGCCIETRDPRSVFEFISNGNLAKHVHEMDPSDLSWESRLRIANEIASAITYLHTGTSKPIIHRDIRSLNILLDEHFTAKVTNFGNSESISESDNGGTNDCMDPEYFFRHDVLGFGKVLFNLLTGKMHQEIFDGNAGSILMEDVDVGTAEVEHFISSLKEKCLCMDRDASILEEGKEAQWVECTKLALRCMQWGERPTMREVAEELGRIKRL
ncbi:wall-associated receptor kinase-like 17 [Magnolia sinica]|uniref:wall-associated receptor kinase-like 17 n=1 Tax=Magnolia sinica TaxID=86752 RepID=UPI002658F5F1|nr:wall-associated receptor kinase-like 17 [Magnolia sinica]XP_058069779.1 wall-associated receptor kinase-like 17 [Magnolia sinica]XP_058069787.1 wall-associated receptor kinase-like 17 [Magnolia sinica]